MPNYKINKHNTKGHFSLEFSQHQKEFYGSKALQEIDLFRRYGNLPDNNLAINKLINCLGNNLLQLEESPDRLPDTTFHEGISLQDEKGFYNLLERTSNALSIDLLCALAPLEQTRGSEAIAVNLENIESIYSNYQNYLIKDILSGESDPIKLNRVKTLIIRLEKQQKHLNKQLGTLQFPIENAQLREVYQQILYDFKDIQNQITFYQRPYMGALEFANQSATEAYQNASYALESHEFSVQTPKPEQLWSFDPKASEKIIISTEQLPAMRRDYALKTYILLSPQYAGRLTESYKELKTELKQVNLHSKHYKQSSPPHKTVKPITSLKTLNTILETNPISRKRYLLENPVLHHEFSDMFSALGEACLSFGKYFEKEMAAKHPVMTTGLFVASSASFGAAGLGYAGVSPILMGQVVHNLSQVLTLGGSLGKVGLTTAKMEGIIQATSIEWMVLTHSKATAFHALIMNGFALPKIVYTLVDTIINGIDDKDTLTQLCARLGHEDLEGKTTEEQTQEILTNVCLMALLLGAAVGIGLGAEALTKLSGLPHTAKLILEAINSLIEVPLDSFTDLGLAHTAAEKAIAIASMILTIESAALFLGKGALLFTHMDRPDIPSKEAVQLIGLLMDIKSRDGEDFDRFIEEHPISDEIKANFIHALETHPQLKEQLGEQTEFFEMIGLGALNPPALTIQEQALQYLTNTVLLIPMLIYGALASLYWTGRSLVSAEYDRDLNANRVQTLGLSGIARTMALTIGKFITKKIILPALCLIPGIISGFIALGSATTEAYKTGNFKSDATWTNNKFFAEGMKIPLALLKIGLMAWTALKTIGMALGETLYRLPLIISSIFINIALIGNALIKGNFILAGEAILTKLGCPLLELVAYPLTQINGLLQGLIAAATRPEQEATTILIEGKPTELSWWDQKTEAFTEARNQTLRTSWFKQLIATNNTLGIALQSLDDAPTIIAWRDNLWSNYNQGYEFIKRNLGGFIMSTRNILRAAEEAVQESEMERMGHIPPVNPTLSQLGGKAMTQLIEKPLKQDCTTTLPPLARSEPEEEYKEKERPVRKP